MLISHIFWMAWEGDLVACSNSDKVFGEGREGRFDDEAKHTSIELVDDCAPSVLDLLLDHGLVGGGVRLELVEEGLWFH